MFGQQLNIQNIQVTSKCSDQTGHMCRLIWAFAGRTYHIVGNRMSRLKCLSRQEQFSSLSAIVRADQMSVKQFQFRSGQTFHLASSAPKLFFVCLFVLLLYVPSQQLWSLREKYRRNYFMINLYLWDRAGIELVTPGSAVGLASVASLVTD